MKHVLLASVILFFFSCESKKTIAEQSSPKDGIVISVNTPGIAKIEDIKDYIASRHNRRPEISDLTAEVKLQAFKFLADKADDGMANGSIDWKAAMYGHVLDLESLHQYLGNLIKANDSLPDSVKVNGVRVYSGALYYKSGFIPEVFLYPTRGDRYTNVYDIDPDYPSFLEKFNSEEEAIEYFKNFQSINTPGTGYNNSLPCPQSCP